MDYSLVIKHGFLEIHPFGSLCFPITKTHRFISVQCEDFPRPKPNAPKLEDLSWSLRSHQELVLFIKD